MSQERAAAATLLGRKMKDHVGFVLLKDINKTYQLLFLIPVLAWWLFIYAACFPPQTINQASLWLGIIIGFAGGFIERSYLLDD